MTIITNYREKIKRFESLFGNKPTASVDKFSVALTEKPQPTDMVNAAANSLRSPLLALKIYLDLLKDFPQEEKKTDVLNRMKFTTNEMAEKINALSTLVDVQTDLNSTKEKVNFSNLLEDVRMELNAQFDLSEITFTTDFIEPSIKANTSELSLLLFQILHNSITYRQDKQPLHITLKTKRVGGYFLLAIKDNAKGMLLKNNDEAKKLFRPFYQLESSNQGIGIGLSIVRSIVDKYRGEVQVRSRINEGSIFNIYLKE
jgi:signal transduction histidine kinase